MTESNEKQTENAVAAQAEARRPAPQIKAGLKVRGLVPQTIEEAAYLAQRFFQSGMYPDSYKVEVKTRDQNGNLSDAVDPAGTQSRILMGILKGMEVGLPPLAAISGIYIVNNKPTIYGDAALALVIDSGLCEGIAESISGKEKSDEWTATCTVTRDGKEATRTFTWAQAKLAGLSGKKGPWTSYPARQMQMRARAFAIRDVFPDVLSGLGITEEVADIPVEAKAPNPESQQDAFTMKALESRTDAAVDFSTLKTADKQPVPASGESVQDEPKTPASLAPDGDAQTADLNEQAASTDPQDGGQSIDEGDTDRFSSRKDKAFPGCTVCGGEGFVVVEQVDEKTGEVDMHDEDCPECCKPKNNDFDLTDLMNTG